MIIVRSKAASDASSGKLDRASGNRFVSEVRSKAPVNSQC